MSNDNSRDTVTIERNKGILILVAAVIVSLALGIGLVKVGTGFASRSSDGIVVTGSAKVSATADNVVWTLSVQESAPSVGTAVTRVDAGIAKLSDYLSKGGIATDAITLGPVSSYAIQEYSNGNPTGRILSHQAQRDLTVRTADVQKVAKLSQGIGALLSTGVNVNNSGPQYYVSTLPALRPQLLSEAVKDAKVRALALTQAVGGGVGAIVSVKSGPFQVTTPDSTNTADMGMYDTSSIEKTVTATVSVTFKTTK